MKSYIERKIPTGRPNLTWRYHVEQASEIAGTSIEDHCVQYESLWHMKQFLRYSWWWPFSPKCLTQARQFLPKGSVAERDLGWRRKGRGDQCFYYRVAYKVREDNNGGEIVWGHENKRARTMVWRLTDWATCELCGRGIRVYYTASSVNWAAYRYRYPGE